MDQIATHSPLTVFSSQSAAYDFGQQRPRAHTRAEVMHFHTSLTEKSFTQDSSPIQKRYSIPSRYFMVCNQFWAHKNHPIVINALKILKGRNLHPVVVMTGGLSDYRATSYIDTVIQSIHSEGIASQVILLGILPREEQIQLLRGCIAVIQPSLFEGWSTVLEDCRILGKKALVSDLKVNIEQDVPGCESYRRDSAEELANLIELQMKVSENHPNVNEEARARKENDRLIEQFGNRFLAIAESACSEHSKIFQAKKTH